ncbi:MAG TPA: hypothetical protein VN176_03450 [Verrucomicrobiae bacterium]|nr:hypothetical protein [Verrucomicrobiae bacterium]
MKTSVLVPLLALLALMLAAPVSFAGDDIGTKLQNQYGGKTLFLRHPGRGDSLEYDSDGGPRQNSGELPWTVYSGMLVEKVEVQPDSLRLSGKRILIEAGSSRELVPFSLKRSNKKKEPSEPPVKEFLQVVSFGDNI